MAQDIRFTNERVLLAAIQAVAATAETLVPANDAILVYDLVCRDMEDALERDIDLLGHGSRPSVPVNRHVSYEFGIELRGAETVGAASPIGRILRGCGFAENLTVSTSAIYSLIASAYEQLTVAGYSHGTLYPGMSARGSINRIEFSIRNFARATVSMMARKIAGSPIADANLPAAVLTAFQRPVAIETDSLDVVIGADTRLNAISLITEMGTQVEMYEGSESQFAHPNSLARPTGTFRCYKDQRSYWNPNSIADLRVPVDVVATVTGGGEIVRKLLKGVEFGRPTDSEERGLAAWDIPYRVLGTTATDAVSISFLDDA